jgi:hypothetical protein
VNYQSREEKHLEDPSYRFDGTYYIDGFAQGFSQRVALPERTGIEVVENVSFILQR